ncbi:hypothetical protein BpHYR1_014339 [Brachionus plicatilis]|uniref:Uncharacterized protein n=1 Tax=Brachionus plicatilis TaxID=10195 RepID=A0A3M7Q829_BRAPC|nr:hypothetical protein BpHYR1_014339 [Brachionus plicatilis]
MYLVSTYPLYTFINSLFPKYHKIIMDFKKKIQNFYDFSTFTYFFSSLTAAWYQRVRDAL